MVAKYYVLLPSELHGTPIRLYQGIALAAYLLIGICAAAMSRSVWRRHLLRQCTPKGCRKAARLREWAPNTYAQVHETLSALLPKSMIPDVIVNERGQESFVLGAGKRAVLVLSISHLMADAQALRFILLHEAAHLRNGDQRTVGLMQSVLLVAGVLYVLAIGPATVAAVVDRTTPFHGKLDAVLEDVAILAIGIIVWTVYRVILRRREFDADLVASALSDGMIPGSVVNASEMPHRPGKESVLARCIKWLGRNHPRPATRLRYLADESMRRKSMLFVPFILGMLLGAVFTSAGVLNTLQGYSILPTLIVFIGALVVEQGEMQRLKWVGAWHYGLVWLHALLFGLGWAAWLVVQQLRLALGQPDLPTGGAIFPLAHGLDKVILMGACLTVLTLISPRVAPPQVAPPTPASRPMGGNEDRRGS